jgi:hypothetical protein
MTPARITEIRELLAKATQGPWRWGDWSAHFGTVESDEHMLTLERNPTRGADPTPYKCTRADGRHQVLSVEASDSFGSNGDNDKAFIAAAPSALAEALDEVERLREALVEVCDLAEEANGDPSSCSYNVPVGDRIAAIRREGGA